MKRTPELVARDMAKYFVLVHPREWSGTDCARYLHMSLSRLTHYCRVNGTTFKREARKRKVSRAVALLNAGKHPCQIYEDVGYSQLNSLYRAMIAEGVPASSFSWPTQSAY